MNAVKGQTQTKPKKGSKAKRKSFQSSEDAIAGESFGAEFVEPGLKLHMAKTDNKWLKLTNCKKQQKGSTTAKNRHFFKLTLIYTITLGRH